MHYRDIPINHDAMQATRAATAESQARAAERAEAYNDRPAVTTGRAPTPVIPPPPNPRLSVPCPQCHAAAGDPCHNYKGQRCHPHGARKLPAQADADQRQAKHAAQDATAARRATVRQIRDATTPDAGSADPRPQPAARPAEPPRPAPTPETTDPRRKTLSAFDIAVEDLVRDHTLSSVLDAAWAASKRLFHPAESRR